MSYYPRGYSRGDKVDDFDDYDPSPYSGGYDMNLTYGRPLSASHDTCYPPSTSSSHDRPTGYNAGGAHNGNEFNSHSSHVHRPHLIDRPHGHGIPTEYGRTDGGGGGDDDERYSHRRKNESEEYERPTGYGRHGKPSYKKHDDEDDEDHHDRPRYDRKKHGDDDASSNEDKDDDDNEKRNRRRGRQHRSYEDE